LHQLCYDIVMTTTINITTDTVTKMRAQRVAQSIGISLDKLMEQYLKGIAHNRVEFPPQRMSKKLERILGTAEKDIKLNRNFSGPFKTGKDAANHLRSL